MMALPLSDIETLFDQIPGIVLYHLSVIIVAIAVLAVLLFHRTRPAGTRAIVVCLSVLVFQLAGFLPYSLSLFSAGTENSIAGILARGLLLGTVLLFGWYCLFPQRTRPWEWIVGFTAFLSIVIGMALSWLLFPPNFTVWFNSQTLSLIWDGIICFWIFFFLLGFLASMLRKKKPSAWGLSLFGLFLMLVGTALQISMFPQPTQLPGLSRFFDLWAFPLLLIQLLVSTAPAANLELFLPEAMGEAGSSDQPAQKIESAFLRFKIRQATAEYAPLLADLFLSEEDEEFVRALTGWLCHAVQAEVAYLLASSDEGQTLVFLSGHDCINARAIPGFVGS